MEKEKVNYNFIDNIRALAMISIVIEHSSTFWTARFETLSDTLLQTFTIQLFKFGTIIFFILAGFLIGEKLKQYTPGEYIKRRISNTFKPWLFWVFILLLLNFVQYFFRFIKSNPLSSLKIDISTILLEISHVVFYTSYWFIINFIVCIALLLVFRRQLYSYTFGLILFLLSLFYSANLYYGFIPTEHTTALFGFIFYLWLGVQIKRHYERFNSFAKQANGYLIALAVIVSLAFSMAESMNLLKLGSDDPFNTLRITNIIYSLITFLALYRLKSLNSLEFLKPRQTTFGIYLIHQIIIFHLVPIIFRISRIHEDFGNSSNLLGTQTLRFVIAYGVSFGLVWLINKAPKIRWIIGN